MGPLVFGVAAQIRDVDVREPGDEQLELLRVEGGDEMRRDELVEPLEESLELRADAVRPAQTLAER